ncbi:hypothetical protein PVAND_013296 [Polypedilum vanderplanki]|uniref:Ionotropic receptor n=1 Tax=Polypedilum vanderplanki TaxID=319348 RepID=A0A9J6CQ83_POLVA|nr:hypothetical protein PVAND_013296 [Polypedilum vanderplanki]
MKFILIILLALCCHSQIIENPIIAIINKFYIQQLSLNFIVHFNDSSQVRILDRVLNYLNNNASTDFVPFMIESLDNKKSLSSSVKRRNVIIFIDNNHDLLSIIFSSLTSDGFQMNGFYTFVILRIKDDDMSNLFEKLWQKFIYNVNILTLDNGRVMLKTFMPFSAEICYNIRPIIINEYDNKLEKWKNDNFFPPKFTNFYNCSLRATTFEYAPAVIKRNINNGSYTLEGSDIELINGLKDILNFHLNLTYNDKPGASGMTYKNGTVTGVKLSLLSNDTDFLFGLYYVTYPNCLYMGCSRPYYAVFMTVIVPQIDLTSLEKFFIPFRLDLWVSLIIVLFLAVFVIAILKHKLKRFRNFIIGSNINDPFNELLTAFIGGSSHKLPRRNFARYLLMIFILFCLVMRSVYIGGLFKYLQSNEKISPFKTIKDLVARDYKLYSHFYFEDYLVNMGLSDSIIIIKPSEDAYYKAKTFDPNFRGGFSITSDELLYLNKLNVANFTYRVCKEHLYTVNNGLLFQNDSFLIEAFDRIIIQLQSNGLINYWITKYIDTSYFDIKKADRIPEQLTLSHLLGSFQMWLCGIILATGSFIIEVIYYKIKKVERGKSLLNERKYILSSISKKENGKG